MLERLLMPISKKVLIYNLVGRDEYGQAQWASMPNQERRGTLRRTTRLEQRGDKAMLVKAYELLLDGKLTEGYPLLGAKVAIEGESKEFVIKALHAEGEPFLSVIVAELEDLK